MKDNAPPIISQYGVMLRVHTHDHFAVSKDGEKNEEGVQVNSILTQPSPLRKARQDVEGISRATNAIIIVQEFNG
jgi:hypothetical protein